MSTVHVQLRQKTRVAKEIAKNKIGENKMCDILRSGKKLPSSTVIRRRVKPNSDRTAQL